jgi:hypothetical protein
MTFPDARLSSLPLHLQQTEPLEPEQLPLQVALLTMELAALRERMEIIAAAMRALAELFSPPADPFTGHPTNGFVGTPSRE